MMAGSNVVSSKRVMRSLALRPTRKIAVGKIFLGKDSPIAIQSMCATPTSDIAATLGQIRLLEQAGAELIRIAVDSRRDVEALREIRKETRATLVVDLQENYRLAQEIAPLVEKFRYNPGHLHHLDVKGTVKDKVKFLVDAAGANDCAIRIGINFGSLDPEYLKVVDSGLEASVRSATEHSEIMESLGFERYVVSLKSSDPYLVIQANQDFARLVPVVPLHLGVTEAGLYPDGVKRTRIALARLLSEGIGDTIRVSLTVRNEDKDKEVVAAREIIAAVGQGQVAEVQDSMDSALTIISCPSCSRVENSSFVELAEKVRELTTEYRKFPLTIAVMGCRVNGPGETDAADLGLWCAANVVHLKRGSSSLGLFTYDEVLPRLVEEIRVIIAERAFVRSENRATSNSQQG